MRKELGQRGEEAVATYLVDRGFSVVGRNVQVGRYEIDIIAEHRDLRIFCEVRTVSSDRFGSPLATIDEKKLRNIRNAVSAYLRKHGSGRKRTRVDAAGVVVRGNDFEIDYREGILQ